MKNEDRILERAIERMKSRDVQEPTLYLSRRALEASDLTEDEVQAKTSWRIVWED